MKWIAAALAYLCAYSLATAAEPYSFEGKTLTMIIGYATGGGTDASGRLIAAFLGRYLPGKPAIVVQNMPGADGLNAANYFAQQVKPDGLTIAMGADTQVDPMHYRVAQAHYDPRKFRFLGGAGRGATSLVIRRDAEHRLYDKSAPPVIMGSENGMPHSGMQATAWGIRFLGWNAKWVVGYRGTSDLMIALRRGEIEMTATANLFTIQDLLDNGTVKILARSSAQTKWRSNSPSDPAPPLFTAMMAHRIKDPLQQKGFDYWQSLTTMDKWLAAPSGTPDDIVDTYRTAYQKMVENPEFLAKSKAISPDFTPQSSDEVERLVKTLGDTPPEAIDFINSMLSAQGLHPGESRGKPHAEHHKG